MTFIKRDGYNSSTCHTSRVARRHQSANQFGTLQVCQQRSPQLHSKQSTSMQPSVDLSASSDSGVLEDETTFSTASPSGQTAANSIVRVKGTGRSTAADVKEKCCFDSVALSPRKSKFRVVAIDAIHLADTDALAGRSTFSGAAEILISLFGDRYRFTSGSINLPGVTRTHKNFRQAANKAGMSRIYGDHITSAKRAGKATGRALAEYIFINFLAPL